MKDYSMNLEERKDFILRYDVTKDGMINIRFANGDLLPIPYNKENEKKVLDKMEEQLVNPVEIEKKFKDRMHKFASISSAFFIMAFFPLLFIADGMNIQVATIMSSIMVGTSFIPGVLAIKNNNKLKDLRKNIKFMNHMKEKLNKAVRSNENTLLNVSNKTKNIITDFPEERDVFDVNSFNYVPFKDLEQIMENVARNERFGFDYEKQEQPIGAIVRKRVR